MNRISKQKGILLLLIVTICLCILTLLLKPFAQPQDYHHFIDQRNWQGIPNATNVLSNIPFALIGIWGLVLLLANKIKFKNYHERWPWFLVAIGLILTAFGSAYYHLEPNNASLVWDRLPMTLIFMSFVAALLAEKINLKFGLWLWPFLLCLGIYSVLSWYLSELQGRGDLRFYALVQIYPIVVALVLSVLPSPYNRTGDLLIIAAFYVLAKLFEIFDKQIDGLTDNLISGHSLKHLAAALAGFWIIRMLWKRKIIEGASDEKII